MHLQCCTVQLGLYKVLSLPCGGNRASARSLSAPLAVESRRSNHRCSHSILKCRIMQRLIVCWWLHVNVVVVFCKGELASFQLFFQQFHFEIAYWRATCALRCILLPRQLTHSSIGKFWATIASAIRFSRTKHAWRSGKMCSVRPPPLFPPLPHSFTRFFLCGAHFHWLSRPNFCRKTLYYTWWRLSLQPKRQKNSLAGVPHASLVRYARSLAFRIRVSQQHSPSSVRV